MSFFYREWKSIIGWGSDRKQKVIFFPIGRILYFHGLLSPLFGIGLVLMATCAVGVGFCVFYFLLELSKVLLWSCTYRSSFFFFSMVLNRRGNKIEWNGEDQERKGRVKFPKQDVMFPFFSFPFFFFSGACTEELAAIACIADFSFYYYLSEITVDCR